MNPFAPLEALLKSGDMRKAREWLKMSNLESHSHYSIYKATVAEGDQLHLWEEAAEQLKDEPSIVLLHAQQKAAYWASIGGDHTRERAWLQKSAELGQKIAHPFKALELQAIYANRLLSDGFEQEAFNELLDVCERAIAQEAQLILIAEGILLSSLLMKKRRWQEAASLSIAIENAALKRHNWIAFAASRMVRATCWRAQKLHTSAISLLLQTGNFLYEQGAVSALNLIRARLTEFRIQLGEDRFLHIVAKIQN
ncbi:MAG: hypothetical protein CMK59_02440 [Proteobacteria bacterium]|nr:hypothetical protein [Pseudomonadota bacterium]